MVILFQENFQVIIKARLSQKQLAKQLKVGPSRVFCWELGESQPQKAMLEKLDMMLKGVDGPSFGFKLL